MICFLLFPTGSMHLALLFILDLGLDRVFPNLALLLF